MKPNKPPDPMEVLKVNTKVTLPREKCEEKTTKLSDHNWENRGPAHPNKHV